MIYTVVGYYENTMQAYCDHIEAADEYAAMAKAKCDTVIGAFPGEHQMTCPCDESGGIAAVEDMADAELIAAMEEL